MTFELYSFRFRFRAQGEIRFPAAKPANILRGALGSAFRKTACLSGCRAECEHPATCVYARIFEPVAIEAGPSGLADWPRPFVFRARHLDGRTVQANDCFWFDINLFDVQNPLVEQFTRAFEQLARDGLGPHRIRLELRSVEQVGNEPSQPISLALDKRPAGTKQIRVEFLTPTELKGADQPEFRTLFARARDRISTLRAMYGAGPLPIDFRAMGERACSIRMTRSDLHLVQAVRRSSRTGQRHGIGGFTGFAEYEGELDEFIPYLEAASWTGVGRHCVWGKGEISVEAI